MISFRNKYYLSFFLILFSVYAQATHNRAGEITVRHVSSYTYEITVTTFTYTPSPADRPELEVQWGDNTYSVVRRLDEEIVHLPDDYQWNKYITTHTYPGPGVYEILVQDPNRNLGVANIPNSVNTIFSIKTTIFIDPQIGYNSTPILLNPPTDKAALGHLFIHNPGAFDPDGDSISYSLTVCTKENGIPIESYTLPPYSDTLFIDDVTGDLIWDTPTELGIYNIAINIEEWRHGVKIGNVVRDMQIQVYDADNDPPEIFGMQNFCVIAEDTVLAKFNSTDPDNDSVFLYASGGPFTVETNKAEAFWDTLYSDYDTIWGGDTITRVNITHYYNPSALYFFWATHCSHVRKQPYSVILRAEDDAEINLVGIETFQVQVNGPPVVLQETNPTNNTIQVVWNRSYCNQVTGYDVYRRDNPSGYEPGYCETGIPSNLDFEKIGETNSVADTFLIDDNNGSGLNQGVEYCYRIVARYRDGAESVVSNEMCDMVVPGTPSLINTSVTKVDDTKGEIFLAWLKPTDIDTSEIPGPYKIIVYRTTNLLGLNFEEIHSFTTPDLADTTFRDSLLNTLLYPYMYKIELYNDEPGNRFLIGNQEISSSLYHNAENLDNKVKLTHTYKVPWVNTEFIVYRQNPVTMEYDSLGITYNAVFVDSNLANGTTYCYRSQSLGYRQINDVIFYTQNWSHIICGTPIDTFPSCPPFLEVTSLCDSMINILEWTNPNNTCADDVIGYNIYYKNTLEGEFQLIETYNDPDNLTFTHIPEESISGCYAVTSIDSFNNESNYSNIVCVDNCIFYKLPNVFSPDGDGEYDVYQAQNTNGYVKEVNMQIFNKWGDLIFETNNPDILWDGTKSNTNRLVSPGVYYYICDVYEPRLTGIITRNLAGFIYVFTDKKTINPTE